MWYYKNTYTTRRADQLILEPSVFLKKRMLTELEYKWGVLSWLIICCKQHLKQGKDLVNLGDFKNNN